MTSVIRGGGRGRKEPTVTIFLDFDGVLTPLPPRVRGGFDWLSKLPNFEKAVRPWLKQVEIVVSSSWRSIISLDDIKQIFSPDVAARITSVTGPDLGDRRKEIERWVLENQRSAWIAVDDHAAPFIDCLDRLIAIDRKVGFTEKDGDALAVKVRMYLVAD